MDQKVFLTGGSGFVGSAVLKALLARSNVSVVALSRDGRLPPRPRVEIARGDVTDEAALRRAMPGCDAAIHLVGIIAERPGDGVTFQRIHVEGTRAVVNAVSACGIRRYVHMSALGTRPDAVSDYHRTKWQAEQIVRERAPNWTIFRPSMIYGEEGEFTQMVQAWAKRQAMPYLFMPYFGKGLTGFGGSAQVQPVRVEDVARAFVEAALDRPESAGKVYDLVGPERMTWPEMYGRIAESTVGKRRLALPVPAWYARLLTAVAPRSLLPFNRDQVIMSQEDNTGDPTPLARDFGWQTCPIHEPPGAGAAKPAADEANGRID